MAANSDEILHDFPSFLRHFKDGRIERYAGTDVVPASIDPKTGVQSKDVEISPENNVSARLYLPANATPAKKLPVLVYFHGGGFVIESAFSPLYHKHLNLFVDEANVVAVSVNYRLAPEHPLPILYEDSWLALKWVGSGQEEWIKDYADLDRVYLCGDSAGGNIAHHMAIRVGSENPIGINLRGVFLNCPFFWGVDPVGNEAAVSKGVVDKLWLYVCPSDSVKGCDDPLINPGMDPNLARFGCKRVLVYVAEKDILKDRGWYYKEALRKSGWDGDIEVVEVKEEGHVFGVLSPDSENSLAMLKKVASFINH
ncbi:hypothetical protein BUALT_Bualt15G0035200 [Buddleja alternifolia]|uniref:Alpha/beta hydrolase fold-3 domain-containing protein n=1 Tax=Buddleja alternifolia TaxID=168488 RepID=A0AAV6WCH6_9LAMI|nr:hypothetical protein BUALT_Bualt15G0035200 [Buddleja alternifolia]